MIAEIIPFPELKDPDDEKVLLTIEIRGAGDGLIWISDDVETAAQFNWVITRIACFTTEIIKKKEEVTGYS